MKTSIDDDLYAHLLWWSEMTGRDPYAVLCSGVAAYTDYYRLTPVRLRPKTKTQIREEQRMARLRKRAADAEHKLMVSVAEEVMRGPT